MFHCCKAPGPRGLKCSPASALQPTLGTRLVCKDQASPVGTALIFGGRLGVLAQEVKSGSFFRGKLSGLRQGLNCRLSGNLG